MINLDGIYLEASFFIIDIYNLADVGWFYFQSQVAFSGQVGKERGPSLTLKYHSWPKWDLGDITGKPGRSSGVKRTRNVGLAGTEARPRKVTAIQSGPGLCTAHPVT